DELLSPPALYAEVGQLTVNLGDRRIEDLIDAPEIQDPRLRAIIELIDVIGVPAFYFNPIAYANIAFRGANFALKHGNTKDCAFPYSACGYALALMMGRVQEGLAFGQLALDLLKKFPNKMDIARVNIAYGCCHPLRGTMRDAVEYFNVARQAGWESG